ncbi:hypothetical protein Poli38472_007469 [Pythium oligandrum]|uniref:Uncharacterized protein n=1 Tax=Pythium oligandrum TaxID=41045 RepID=A0A8K1CS87_PYTOL|nr:hypothetical protein Poli38472_007469 [Pythium oligandrum]|eukprot:TMW67797.1 hypothetical protein Poli38472_007469 [Pythium oligandrum]
MGLYCRMSTPNNDRRWSLARATEFFSGDGKPDMLDIRGMTAVTKGATGKRDKFRKSVSRCGVSIYGPKHSQSAEVTGAAGTRERIFIEDPRAPCLTIDYTNEAYRLMPSSEKFSAHTGVCQILGTKCIRGGKHRIRVGDIIRFGSVGLLVTEIDTAGIGPNDATLSPSEINSLIQRVICHDEAIADVDSGLDTDDDAGDASGNDESKPRASAQRQSTSAMCYVCYDESEEGNPLISPCKCAGDTKYIHLNCLKRWNTNGEKNEICTVLDESNARTCSICKAPYPSKTRLPNGKFVSLLPDRLNPPTIMFQVVTKHSSSTLNLSTRYQLSYKMLLENDIHRPLMVGRSSQCDLVLKYRTVSTIHAEIHYAKGEFFLKDAGSSNGTLRYIYRPLSLHNNQSLHVKFGRTVLSIKPTKKIRLPHFFGGSGGNAHPHSHHSGRPDSFDEEEENFRYTPTNARNNRPQNPQTQPNTQQQPQQQSINALQSQFQNLDM